MDFRKGQLAETEEYESCATEKRKENARVVASWLF
jgi:hypothetical protein